MNEINKLFGVNIKDIAYVFLADNKWYELADTLAITGTDGKTPQYFNCWVHDREEWDRNTGYYKCIVGDISQIALARTKQPSVPEEKVVENWKTIVSKVSESSTSLGSFLSEGELLGVRGFTIQVGFPKYRNIKSLVLDKGWTKEEARAKLKNNFKMSVLKKNSRKIEKIILSVLKEECWVLNARLRIDFRLNISVESELARVYGEEIL
jgi:hypothetical protein